jgi:hypothetical protein
MLDFTCQPFDLKSLKFGSYQMDEMDDGGHQGAFFTTCLETNQEIVTPWHPPPLPSPFIKRILVLFVLLSYVLQHYNWEKETINRFKV